jgi:solute carrier family 35 (adenosine 3'-phospho 5'-phosphosulfate transporter), member B2
MKNSTDLVAMPIKTGKDVEANNEEKKSLTKSKDPWSVVYKGLYSFFGLQFSYLIWGMMQELIMTTKFNPTPSVPSGMFPSASFCVFSNRFLAIVISYVVITTVHGSISCSAPSYAFLPCAISNTASSWAQYSSLHYVSFPLQNIFKSTKVIPVMLMGMILRGVTYSFIEYVEAIAITAGVFVFSMAKNSSKAEDVETSITGVILLVTYVCSDSFTSQWQSRLYKDYGKIDQYHMMFWVNTWAVMLTLGALIFSGEFLLVLDFLYVNPTALLYNIITAVTSATGQFFIFYTIKEFGPIVFTVIMTTRQMLSMVLSSVFFGHPMYMTSYLGTLLVFGAVFHSIRRQMRDGKGSSSA